MIKFYVAEFLAEEWESLSLGVKKQKSIIARAYNFPPWQSFLTDNPFVFLKQRHYSDGGKQMMIPKTFGNKTLHFYQQEESICSVMYDDK